MSRTRGAKDLKRRKRRSDRVKKKHYKRGSFPKAPKGRKTMLKIWWWEQRRMSREGRRRWAKHLRVKIRNTVYKPTLRMDVPVERLRNSQEIERLAEEYLWDGTWLMMSWSHAKTPYHCKPVKLAMLRITDHPAGLRAKLIRNFRLFRYWYWDKR